MFLTIRQTVGSSAFGFDVTTAVQLFRNGFRFRRLRWSLCQSKIIHHPGIIISHQFIEKKLKIKHNHKKTKKHGNNK
jgi:hypothetical protein